MGGSLLFSCGQSHPQKNITSQTAMTKDNCVDPDANINCCFRNMPIDLTNTMIIGDGNEAGDKLIISGIIYKSDGKSPYPGVIIYAYHTDNTGHYSKKGDETGIQKWHGHLYGWCKTDNNGHYTINTIRQAQYPNNTFPAHIHSAFKLPDNSEPFYINDFVFKDDKYVTQAYISSLTLTGGSGVIELSKSSDGIWKGKRDIIISK